MVSFDVSCIEKKKRKYFVLVKFHSKCWLFLQDTGEHSASTWGRDVLPAFLDITNCITTESQPVIDCSQFAWRAKWFHVFVALLVLCRTRTDTVMYEAEYFRLLVFFFPNMFTVIYFFFSFRFFCTLMQLYKGFSQKGGLVFASSLEIFFSIIYFLMYSYSLQWK